MAVYHSKLCLCRRARPRTVAAFDQRNACFPNPPNLPCWCTSNDCVRRHVLGYHSPRRDCCPSANSQGSDAHGTSADRCAEFDLYTHGQPVIGRLLAAVGVDRTRVLIICEDCSWPNKDPSGEYSGLVNQSVVLNLAAVAYLHAGPDVGTATNDALLANLRVAANVCKVPHPRSITENDMDVD